MSNYALNFTYGAIFTIANINCCAISYGYTNSCAPGIKSSLNSFDFYTLSPVVLDINIWTWHLLKLVLYLTVDA